MIYEFMPIEWLHDIQFIVTNTTEPLIYHVRNSKNTAMNSGKLSDNHFPHYESIGLTGVVQKQNEFIYMHNY